MCFTCSFSSAGKSVDPGSDPVHQLAALHMVPDQLALFRVLGPPLKGELVDLADIVEQPPKEQQGLGSRPDRNSSCSDDAKLSRIRQTLKECSSNPPA
jgi:hypothetical protein